MNSPAPDAEFWRDPLHDPLDDTVLLTHYRGLVCDLDGVVYRGAHAVPGAVETLNSALGDGIAVAFATNNASRPPGVVGEHLRELGIDAEGWTVVTSSQAAAAYVLHRFAPGAKVLAVGGPGVVDALVEYGLTPLRLSDLPAQPEADAPPPVDVIVQGLGTEVMWKELTEIGHLTQQGVPWVATNIDLTIPSSRGLTPGNGSLIAAVQVTTPMRPHVVGKPGAALYDLSRSILGVSREATLAIGDRVDTDIAGANAAGLDSLLVMSGACRLRELASAPPALRPTYVAHDLTGLMAPAPRLRAEAEGAEVTAAGEIRFLGDGGDDASRLRAAVSAAWDAADDGREFSSDDAMWQRLEDEVGLKPV